MTSIPWSFGRRAWLVASAAGLVARSAPAQSSRTVRIIVGFPPGQATDTVARLMSDRLHAVTGQNYIVENRPGQGGSLAMGLTAKAPPDGSVMMLTHMSAVATNPHLYRTVPYNSLTDYAPVGLIGDLPFVMVCNPALPFSTVQELISYAKANPDKLTHSSSGNGTVSHLQMEEFKRRAGGLRITHVPYKGSAPALTDVVAGTVSIALETLGGTQSFVQSGRLRALGVATPSRIAALPNVPTIAEQGFPGFTASTWLMVLYPAGTAPALVESTFVAVGKAMQTPEVEKQLVTIGEVPRFSQSPAEAAAYVKSEFASWGESVRRSGVQLE